MLKNHKLSEPNSLAQLSDEQVIEQVLKSEAAMYELLIRRYNPYVYKIGRSYGFRHEETEDLMQETFVNAFFNLSNFRKDSSFKTWLTRIMLNNCYHKSKKLSRKKELTTDKPLNDKVVPLYPTFPGDGSKAVTNNELKTVIEGAIAAIPIDYRMVFSLRVINGLSTAETASLLEISEANVKVRLNRAKKLLRGEIEKMYSPDDIFEFNLVYCDRIVEQVMHEIKQR